MSSIRVTAHNLANVKYDDLLKDVARRIKMISTITDSKQSILKIRDDAFAFDIDRIAEHVGQQYATSTNFPFEQLDGVSYATTHMDDLLAMKTFSDLVREQIVRPLQEQIQKVLQSTTTTNQTDLVTTQEGRQKKEKSLRRTTQ